jgi:hypothetical protein
MVFRGALSLATFVLVAACGAPRSEYALEAALPPEILQDIFFSVKVDGIQPGSTVSAIGFPDSFSFEPETQTLSGYATSLSPIYGSIVAQTDDAIGVLNVELPVRGDSLAELAWFLHNTGQTVYTSVAATLVYTV